MQARIRDLLLNKTPVFTWRGEAAPGENWGFTGILFYGKPLRYLLLVPLTCGAIALSTNLAIAQTAPTSPPTIDPAMLLPVGQVDPAKPFDVMVLNNTSTLLAIGFPGGANVKIEPSTEVTVSLPAAPTNLFIYPFGQNASTQYNYTISGNTIMVEVIPKDSEAPGDRALNINETGIVSIY